MYSEVCMRAIVTRGVDAAQRRRWILTTQWCHQRVGCEAHY